jgi:hypothetical protein
MSDFLISMLISIGIVTISMGIVFWLTIRRADAQKTRAK